MQAKVMNDLCVAVFKIKECFWRKEMRIVRFWHRHRFAVGTHPRANANRSGSLLIEGKVTMSISLPNW
ncbi:MAG: hypothetical protein P4L51_11170, partial [Puia sp.]|nr:hypothetical protein [Puia sp.]